MELSLWLNTIFILNLISEFTAQTYNGVNKGYKTFPIDIPANSKEINLQ